MVRPTTVGAEKGLTSTLAETWWFRFSRILRQRPNRVTVLAETSDVKSKNYFLDFLHQRQPHAGVSSSVVFEVPVSRGQLLLESEI